jgi:PAS domain-containing protein
MQQQADDGTRSVGDHRDDAEMFDLAPVSLWLEDYSLLKAQFEEWRRAGVNSLRDYLREDPSRVKACSDRIRVIKVNRTTLALHEADDLAHLVQNLGLIFRDDMLKTHVEELVQLWDGKTEFSSGTVNYTLSGRRLDIRLKGMILPGYEEGWERVLVAIEDVTARESARRQLIISEVYARGLFEHSPVSLWVEDFSSVKRLLDEVRDRGITDFRVFTDVHPEFVLRCMSEIRVIDVNRHRSSCSLRQTGRPCCGASATCSATTCSSTSGSNWSTCGTASFFSSARSSTIRSMATSFTFICNSRCCRAMSRTGRWSRWH